MKKAALLLLAATSASATFLRADVRTGINPQSATNACSQHNLCGSCLSESACVWCAVAKTSVKANARPPAHAREGPCGKLEAAPL